MPTLTEPVAGVSTLDLIVRRAGTLYSLPAVAVEMLDLIENPKSDIRDLKECLQQDPALAAKVLRVVNSSLFGLSQPIGDLNDAVALLGIRQLKLLVLGFSLPEQLFLGIAGEQLDWYWNTTLARAVAAREVSEKLFKRSGDEAFLAGLLQDLGVLVMLRELGGPYAALVTQAMSCQADLGALEQTALGFDHVQLTAGLLNHWRMPPSLVRAVTEPRQARRMAKSRDPHAPLVRVLHLAELLAQLVGQHRLSVLPDLLEAGQEYCDLDKARLNELVASLEPKGRQLADILSIDAARSDEYAQVLLRAHEAMSRVAESIAGPAARHVDPQTLMASELRKSRPASGTVSIQEINAAVARFLERPERRTDPWAVPAHDAPEPPAAAAPAKSVRQTWSRDELSESADVPLPQYGGPAPQELQVRLTLAVGQARAARQPLSLVALVIEPFEPFPPEQARTADRLLEAVCRGGDSARDPQAPDDAPRRLLILAGRDRQEAVDAARKLVLRLQQLVEPLQRSAQLAPCVVAAGVGSVVDPPKNFEALRLLETAQRCLVAAVNGGGVKSLEVI
ncbi:MAG TPA: HDOD domain-containing protein [Lacipirellulaceae bacterium]|nr:HDOD domain-containing protein [Lacipirellulaceae bacterium]